MSKFNATQKAEMVREIRALAGFILEGDDNTLGALRGLLAKKYGYVVVDAMVTTAKEEAWSLAGQAGNAPLDRPLNLGRKAVR